MLKILLFATAVSLKVLEKPMVLRSRKVLTTPFMKAPGCDIL